MQSVRQIYRAIFVDKLNLRVLLTSCQVDECTSDKKIDLEIKNWLFIFSTGSIFIFQKLALVSEEQMPQGKLTLGAETGGHGSRVV